MLTSRALHLPGLFDFFFFFRTRNAEDYIFFICFLFIFLFLFILFFFIGNFSCLTNRLVLHPLYFFFQFNGLRATICKLCAEFQWFNLLFICLRFYCKISSLFESSLINSINCLICKLSWADCFSQLTPKT